ncbi:salicylate synthase [Alloactinosynnema sp. L-07]|uniref:salicylate synthase n=1 Tax=Alloactinosynnema sp. L-07 TaxID=1653480 RepID=UPI001E56C7F1|nr:salicylate synthase [Alloactinosynnema sp. L-07]
MTAVAALARQADGPFVVYERDGRWTFASGAVAELRMNRHAITIALGGLVRSVSVSDDPLAQISTLLAELRVPWRRAYGWAGFELAHLLHGVAEAAGDAPLMHIVVPAEEVVFQDGGVELHAADDRGLDRLQAALDAPAVTWGAPHTGVDLAAPDDPAYRAAVAAAVEDIRAERLQKVILSRVVSVPMEIDLVATYVAGRRGNTPARSFLLDLGGLRATGFSPETVVEVYPDGRVSTQPLAGTRGLVGDPATDLSRRVELLGDPKEVFEHAISVRLAQDELETLCRPGSVTVDEFMTIKERGSVQHLASRVSGKLADGKGAWHAFAALFPAITASGIPKPEAFDLIARHEEPRGLYSGAVLAIDADGGFDAALVLRTVFSQDGRTWLRAGAGVVGMSTPERELEETREKLRSISRFLVPADPTGATVVSTSDESVEPDLTVAGLRHIAADLTEEEPAAIDAQANLFELGLESIALMKLVSTWRQAGIDVNFAELAGNPTLDGWSKLLAERRPVTAVPASSDSSDDPDDETFGLAVLQHAYWVGRTAGHRLGGVAAHLYSEFDGSDIDPERLTAAIGRLIERHDMLRVVITDNGRQRIAETSGWRGLVVHDLRDIAEDERTARLEAIRDANSHRMLDIEAGEVFATELTLLPDGRTRLHLDVDMVAADAVSYRIMLADLAELYADHTGTTGTPGYSFRQYRSARPQARAEAARDAALWWRDRLPDLPGAPDLPAATRRRDSGKPRVTRRATTLSPEQRAALADRARTQGITPAMAVATAFAEVIGTWSAEPRFLINVPLFDREPIHPDVAEIVGDFTSSVLLEIDLSRPASFADRARQTQSRMHADAAHADFTGVEVLRDLTRLRGEQVLAPIVFTSALSLGELFDEGVRRSFGDAVWIISQGPQVLLDAQVTELDGGLLVNWDSRDDEFADGVVDAMFAAFSELVHTLAADADAWTRPVAGLLPAAQVQRRASVNETGGLRAGRRLHDGFFAEATRNPDAIAVLGTETITYGDLADRALRVAGALVARGVRPGDTVGVTLPKGPDQIVAVLGVLAAGGTYVPVGVEQPEARVRRIADLAGYRVLIGETPGTLTLAETRAGDPLPEFVRVDQEDLAYVLFTSGSTGEPKGVEVPHRAAMATIDDLIDRFELGGDDRTLALSALDFDLSVFDLFAPLSVGGAVVIASGDRRDAAAWGELIAEHRVTVLNCVPALLDMVLTSGTALGDSLRLVLLGGDWVGVDLPARLAEAVPGCRFVALGGTTETAIHSTVCEVTGPVPEHWHAVPYGTPLRGVRCRVVDAQGRDCPEWVPGELWIGGDGVARGYRGDPDRTADRFVTHEGLRWYRTGDIARYLDDGGLEFLGRRDDQVKIRGYRVELGEVEAALVADAAVREAVAVVTGAGRRTLVAGVVPDSDAVDPIAVADRVRELVPTHMVPDRIVVLDAIPLSTNGKVDRSAVRRLIGDVAREDGAGPQSPLENVIDLVWREVLGLERVGRDEELFTVGGDSVIATAIVSRLRELLDTRTVTVRTLFAAPTVAGFAAELILAQDRPGRLESVAELVWEIESLSDDEVLARAEGLA